MPLLLVHKRCSELASAPATGRRNQQLARWLAFSTVEQRERMVRAFAAHAESYPWLSVPEQRARMPVREA